MNTDEIKALFNKHWKIGWGSVAIDELEFIQDLIRTHRPKTFLEVGMASGMSTGFIANFMAENGGEHLISVDHDDTFFGDKSKANGFLVPELFTGATPKVDLVKFKTALNVPAFEQTFDMVFIDANHQHPWPLIDTLAIWPYLSGPKLVIHHDLNLFMKQDVMFGIGPKYLHDQFDDDHRHVSTAQNGNIFVLDLNLTQKEVEDIAIKAMKLPWSLRTALQPTFVEQIRTMLKTQYSQRLCDHFERCLKANNMTDRFRSGL